MDANNTRVRGMLGFAMRAGRLVLGTEQVCIAMAKPKRTRPRLVLLANGISPATRKKLITKSAFYGIPYLTLPMDQDTLGTLLGKSYAPATVAVMDDAFAKQLQNSLEEWNLKQFPDEAQDKISLVKGSFPNEETGMTDGAN